MTPSTNLYPNYAGDSLPTWVLGSRATLIGDAAHAHGGAFAAGGSLALDDALALGLSLKQFLAPKPESSITAADVRNALELYTKVRKPHTDRLIQTVHSQISQKPSNFNTPEQANTALIKRFKTRPNTDWLSEHDVEATFAAAVRSLESGSVRKPSSSSSSRGGSGKDKVTVQVAQSKL